MTSKVTENATHPSINAATDTTIHYVSVYIGHDGSGIGKLANHSHDYKQ